MMAKDCWCSFKFHLPGEKKRHAKAKSNADRMLALAEAAEKRGKN